MPFKDFINLRILTTSLLIVGYALSVHGQELTEFEADSIYYTPIPKPTSLPPEPVDRHVFLDTARQSRTGYFYNFQFGHLFGQKTESDAHNVTFTTSTLHGVTIGRKLRAGVGLGIDAYLDWTALPVFGSVSWDLAGTQNTHAFFVQLNYGWPLAVWRSGSLWNSDPSEEVSGGRMISPQIGYRVNCGDMRFSLSIGTKIQKFKTIFESPSYFYLPDGTQVLGTYNRTTIEQNVNRFMINVSFGWR
jgi:hypothetical protein